MILCDGAATALLPAIAHLSVTSPGAATSLLRNSASWLLMVSVAGAILTTALSPVLVTILFGSQYAVAAPLLAVAIWRVPIACLSMLQGHALFAVKRQDLVLRTGAAATFVSILLVYPMVQLLGPLGGVLALHVRPLLAFLLRAPAMAHHFPNMWPWRQLGRIALSLLLMTFPLLFVPALGLSWELLLYVAAAAGLYLLSLVLLGVLPLGSLMAPVIRRLSRSHSIPEWAAEAAGRPD
jgi:O-antigen/teichoic acid export membrane protein